MVPFGPLSIAFAVLLAMPSPAHAHPDMTTHEGILAYLIAAILAVALLVVGAWVHRLVGRAGSDADEA